MPQYKASIKHSEKTIKDMATAQYDAFRGWGYYVVFIISLLCLATAVFAPKISQGIKIVLLITGSFTIVALNSPPKQLADQVIKSLNGKYPEIGYIFTEESVKLTGTDNTNTLEYSNIIRLTEEKEYLYIFIRNKSAYMIDRSTIKPDCDGLMNLVSQKTGLEWTKNASVLNTSIKLILKQNKNTKQ